MVVVLVRLQSSRRELRSLTVEHQSTTEAHRALMDKERKLAKELEARREEVKELKQDLGSQKKKGHSNQEETKSLRAEIKRLTDDLEHTRKERPAFESRPVPKEATKLQADPKPAPEVKPKPAPELRPEPVRAATADAETREKLERTEIENKHLVESLRTERDERDKAREELRQLKRRVESFRRVDIITKGKLELLEDRVKGLGRQYYDAVSELAVLKGEVAPPRPRDLERPPIDRTGDAKDMSSAEAEEPGSEDSADA